ncbi:MAG: Nif3-like dinuclear metal center hexameric protein [Fibrobacteraceae bacterium]|nr:Nif3-like dinuclear metal center hexameric protein [Fibrobacteraceae bacterium]
MQLSEFSSWLDALLVPSEFKDFCPDGLCVEANDKVTRLVTGVSFSEDLVDAAIERKADCILVHHLHGFWNNERRIPVGPLGRKLKKLFCNGICLYGFHLPLDGHIEVGNNAQIAKAFGLESLEWYMMEGKRPIACTGRYANAISAEGFLAKADAVFPKGFSRFLFGKKDILKVAVCSGSAGMEGIEASIAQGADILVTGEIRESTPIFLKENGFNLVAAGHYRTEVFGVRALASKIESELGIKAEFVDLDNPV